jgi:hypothetical protein
LRQGNFRKDCGVRLTRPACRNPEFPGAELGYEIYFVVVIKNWKLKTLLNQRLFLFRLQQGLVVVPLLAGLEELGLKPAPVWMRALA